MAMNRLRKATGLVTDVRWLFETPSLAALAERIECTEQAKHTGTDTLNAPGRPEPDAIVALTAP
ncbi:hypothetical protein [Neopusillimonas aromaticivorans]|uniref:hypothetical protein n=1 Tax=Neopusillimonas aromaticivorans TaxID=2979868 RepID=UPI0025955E34|nr:hypothetical protein [Neopusillimonas aromaticivorans]WJJ92660.1 hypothetical protein N7E01_09960 [Neopusillimonas aromaticivorans]